MKLSIIIPIYNTEKYIEKCIESILCQNLEKYEILLINDGSTDKSKSICEKYAIKYEFIKLFTKKNEGAAAARNFGLLKATGEYIMFVDSDDFISHEISLKEIVENLTGDVIQFKMKYYYSNKNKYLHIKYKKIEDEFNNTYQFLKEQVKSGQLSVSPCDKFVKRSVIEQNNIFFNEDIVAEDIDWSLELYLKTKSISFLNEEVYCYRQNRKGSVTNMIRKKNIESLYYVIYKWYNYNYTEKNFKYLYLNYLAYQYIILLSIINNKNCDNELKKKIFNLKIILKYSDNYKVKLCNRIIRYFWI